ncbi:MAG: DUF1576 domain-containing protein [Bacillota bacterium]
MKKRISNNSKFMIIGLYMLVILTFAFLSTPIHEILNGIYKIIFSTDLLISDYLMVGGLGAAFLNSGLLGLFSLLLIKKIKTKINGLSVAAIFTIAGFSLFGKNLVNVIPIIIGVWGYSFYQKEKFNKYIIPALFGTALAPMVTQIAYTFDFSIFGILLGCVIGIIIGFIVPPISSHVLVAHEGFNLYNVGFTSGIIGTVMLSTFRSFNFDSQAHLLWSTEYTKIIFICLCFYFLSMVILGFILTSKNNLSINKLKNLWQRSGRAVTDFVITDGFPLTLINMGIMGLLYTLLLIIIKAPLNGPTVGGIFTIVGFSAFGKHPFNTGPIVLGVLLGALTKGWALHDPAFILALLFSTTLAPIAGFFGSLSGIIAGFLHLSVVMNVTYLHGGLNLYNNGFSGGLVATFLYPLLDGLKKE